METMKTSAEGLPEVEHIFYDGENDILNFHIPGSGKVKEVAGLGKDEVKKIAKEVVGEVFPDELKQKLEQGLKDIGDEALQHVLIPFFSEALKPAEKLIFSTGHDILKESYRTVKTLVQHGYKPNHQLIDLAIHYANEQAKPAESSWAKWLGEMGVDGWPKDPDVEKSNDYWGFQVEQWDGWKPFVTELHKYEASQGYTVDEMIADFNKINFYIANAGNLAVGLYFRNLYDRAPAVIAELDRVKETGIPFKRHDIHAFIAAIGPDAVDLTATAKIELGISIGGSLGLWGIPGRLCLHLIDDAMRIAKVPA